MAWSRRYFRGLRWVLACGCGIAALAAALPGGIPPAAASAASAVPGESAHWRACGYAAGFQCAYVQVPLDYAQPEGQKIQIAVIRHLATDPARRVGSLVVNPGGPGGPGTVVLPLIYNRFPAAVRERFDIVSFDPRGIGRSDGLQCFATQSAENQLLGQWSGGFPVGSAQILAWDRTYLRFDRQCARDGGPVLQHMSTADVARDMDVIRRALGERLLSYYGISYGTILGATYANLFPAHAGAMVLDGNIDPAAWTTADGSLPTALRMGSDLGSAATLGNFLELCGRAIVSDCAFSAGSPAATRGRYATLLRRLQRHPVTVGSPPQTYTYASTVSTVDDFLYTTSSEPAIGQPGWQTGAALLQRLWEASGHGGGAPAPVSTASPATATAASAQPYNGAEQELGVECADSPNPADPGDYAVQGRLAARRAGAFGPMWAWQTEPCSSWPATGQDRYTGPWSRRTASPILVVGNISDPATPYQDAVAMSRELARGRLLTVAEYGHTLLLNGNSCATGYVTRYLLTGALPRAGTVCGQEGQPFSPTRSAG
jgi:pimeloyl-ACP methyl ester carboxylesterase